MELAAQRQKLAMDAQAHEQAMRQKAHAYAVDAALKAKTAQSKPKKEKPAK